VAEGGNEANFHDFYNCRMIDGETVMLGWFAKHRMTGDTMSWAGLDLDIASDLPFRILYYCD
jgi:hypothetical protein